MIVLVALSAAVLGTGLGVAALEYPNRSGPADAAAAIKCVTRPAITVAAAPQIAAAVSATATHWLAGHPAVGGACPTIDVQTVASATEEAALSRPGADRPDLWIADSSVWVTRLRDDAAAAGATLTGMVPYPSIASSPLVIATTAGHQTALTQVAAQGWAATMASTAVPMGLIDPTTSTDGLLGVLALTAAGGPSVSSTMTTLAKAPIASATAGLADLRARPATAASFPASEQDVISVNAGGPAGGTPVAVAVYPQGPGLQLDFPVVQFTPTAPDSARQSSAAAFVTQLAQPFALAQFANAGLRDPAGDPLSADLAAIGVGQDAVAPVAPPGLAAIKSALSSWKAARAG